MTIRGGEKAFTDKARAAVLRQYRTAIGKLGREIMRLGNDADAIMAAKTLADLERIRRRQHSGDPGDLYYYACDDREVCAHCGKLRRGGIHGLPLSRPAYYCWKEACSKAFDKAYELDRKKHPKLYAAADRRAAAQRKRGMANSRRNRRRRSK